MNVPVLVIILQIIFLVGVTTPTSVLRQTRQIDRGCAHHSRLCAAHTTQIDHRPTLRVDNAGVVPGCTLFSYE